MLRQIDLFKVTQNFYMDHKSKGRSKKFSQFYGSILGSFLSLFLILIAVTYLTDLVFQMASGQNDFL
jgi:hypothetical protein